ncbi:hypothetical protein EYC80_006153 [Monilinia laxa]|uniref:Uncharacterized protein n=1 Tax=Monilinia laxa TaxID=61186 RepID=A0A5N6KGM6_MONLA|nr:hypothetical protein EYC80_006153 [Monilinia laxa]
MGARPVCSIQAFRWLPSPPVPQEAFITVLQNVMYKILIHIFPTILLIIMQEWYIRKINRNAISTQP